MGYSRVIRGVGTFHLTDVPARRIVSFVARSFSATENGVYYKWDPSPSSGSWESAPYLFYGQTIIYGVKPGRVAISVSGLPNYASWATSYSGSGPLATTYGVFGGRGSGTSYLDLNPGTYTFSYGEASGYPGSYTEIWVPSPSSAGPSAVSSESTLNLTVSYSGPLPGTFLYCTSDATVSSRSVPPGCYTSGSVPRGVVLVDADCPWTERRIGQCSDGRTKYEVCTMCYEDWRVCHGGTYCISSRETDGARSRIERVTTVPRTCETECR